jgi:tRNA (mo5U34)-methyltransferase
MKNHHRPELIEKVNSFEWYHTIDLGNGLVTPGQYDHRPLLKYYRIPQDLSGKTVVDIGVSHGFFSFEFERRGAKRVVATELPLWSDHDGSPQLKKGFKESKEDEKKKPYLHGAFDFAKKILNSKVELVEMSVYDISSKTIGIFDIVFCGSLLIHLSDPLKALYNIQSVTRELFILSTVIHPQESKIPLAYFHGTVEGMAFWAPNMTCLEKMCLAAGFNRVERISTFNLISTDKVFNNPHGVVHSWNI